MSAYGPICHGCGKPVQRNKFILNDQAWHYGCAKAKGVVSKAVYYCPECGRFFTYARIHRCTLGGEVTLMCPNCHSLWLRHIRRSPERGRWL